MTTRSVLALLLIFGLPVATLAQGHGGSGGSHASSGSSSHASAPARPAAPPVQRPAGQSYHPAPVYQGRPTGPTQQQPQPQNGFNMHRDVNPGVPPHSVAPVNRAPLRVGGPYQGQFNGPAVHNPHHWNNWGWNHGTPWYPAPIYWGGGFWGPYAAGAFAVGFFLGSIIDYQNQYIYPSYQVAPSSPGAQLLQNYGLQQTECGPPNLVVIWGPDNSVICAYPNDMVAAGNYELDPTTLTIVSK